MSKYYLHDGQNQQGPFTIEELIGKNIIANTHVWKEGMNDWVMADSISELNELFKNEPPPFKAFDKNPTPPKLIIENRRISNTEKAGTWIGRNPKLALMILILFGFGGIVIYNMQSSNTNIPNLIDNSAAQLREKTPEELRAELQAKEKESPTEYLTSNITMRENLIGEKVFEGTISNNASTATFKDIVLEISYLSKTKSIIKEESFKIYEIVRPQQTISIKKIKTFSPDATDAFSVRIVNALSVEQ